MPVTVTNTQTDAELEQRQRFLMWMCDRLGEPLRCAKRIDGTRAKDWRFFPAEVTVEEVHYRSVPPFQTVFDIGDHTLWQRTKVETEAIWEALRRLNVDFVPTLSGGRGTHTEVYSDEAGAVSGHICANCFHAPHKDEFCREEDLNGEYCLCRCPMPTKDGEFKPVPTIEEKTGWRLNFHSHVLSIAHDILAEHGWRGMVDADSCTKDPNSQNQLVRDYGQRKDYFRPERKWMWPIDEHPELPWTVEEAYEIAFQHPMMPDTPPINEGLAARFSHNVPGCPKSPDCFRPSSNDGWPGCGRCPFWA